MAKETPVERVQTQAIGTAITIVTAHREQDADRQRQLQMGEDQRGGVGAEPIRGGVAERIEPAIAHQEIEAHGEQAEDQRFDQDRQRILRHHERQQRAGNAR